MNKLNSIYVSILALIVAGVALAMNFVGCGAKNLPRLSRLCWKTRK